MSYLASPEGPVFLSQLGVRQLQINNLRDRDFVRALEASPDLLDQGLVNHRVLEQVPCCASEESTSRHCLRESTHLNSSGSSAPTNPSYHYT